MDVLTTAAAVAGRWELRECHLLCRDLWRNRRWPGWFRLGFILAPTVVVAMLCIWASHTPTWTLLGVSMVTGWMMLWNTRLWRVWGAVGFAIVPFGMIATLSATVAHTGSWVGLAIATVPGYMAAAALTGLPRARHNLRVALRYGAGSITRGNYYDHPNPNQRHNRQPKAQRVRWVGHRTRWLDSATIVVPPDWPQGTDQHRLELGAEVESRLQPHAADCMIRTGKSYTYATDWSVEQNRATLRVRRVPALHRTVYARLWTPPAGVALLGATGNHNARATVVDKQAFAAWNLTVDPHLLVTGSTGRGKTVALRWLVVALTAAARAEGGHAVFYAIDGKEGNNFAFLTGRAGCHVANTPHEWRELIQAAADEMNRRNKELSEWRHIRADPERWFTVPKDPPPIPNRLVLTVDELVDVQQTAPDVIGPLCELARKGRETRCTVVASVLRADTAESIPGLVRDQLTGRLLMGEVASQEAARMMFDEQWRLAKAASNPADADIAGRGVARLSGRIHKVQVPLTPDAAQYPRAAEMFLPPRGAPKPEVGAIIRKGELEAVPQPQNGNHSPAAATPEVLTLHPRRARAGAIHLTNSADQVPEDHNTNGHHKNGHQADDSE